MSYVDEVHPALRRVAQKTQAISSAVQDGVLGLEEADALLIHAAANNASETYTDAAWAFMHAKRLLQQAQGLLRQQGMASVEGHSAAPEAPDEAAGILRRMAPGEESNS
jgi:hypothetical protein